MDSCICPTHDFPQKGSEAEPDDDQSSWVSLPQRGKRRPTGRGGEDDSDMSHAFRKFNRRDFLRLALIGGAVLAIPLLRRGLGPAEPDQAYQRTVTAMGTTVTIRIEDQIEQSRADFAAGMALREINRLAKIMTRFPDGTQLYDLNRTGRLDTPSPEVVEVLNRAMHFSQASEGSFDVTVKPVLDLLDGYLSGQQFPTDAQFEAARDLIDYESVSVADHSISLTKPGTGVTLDGIAEGYILDQAALSLRKNRIRSALVNIGGSLEAIGTRTGGAPWEVGIVDPVHPDRTLGTLLLKDQAVATSGDYENFYTGDKQYYHIVDPSTARSPLYSHSATVVSSNAVEADQMGVVLMVEEPNQGQKIADARGCEYLICTRTRGSLVSEGMEELMT